MTQQPKPDSNSHDELRATIENIVNNRLFNNDVIDNSGDKPKVIGRAGVEALVNLVDNALQAQADKMLECLPEKQDPLAPDTMFDEVLGFNQALDLCRQAIKEQMKGRK